MLPKASVYILIFLSSSFVIYNLWMRRKVSQKRKELEDARNLLRELITVMALSTVPGRNGFLDEGLDYTPLLEEIQNGSEFKDAEKT